jgi:hypothetical protein
VFCGCPSGSLRIAFKVHWLQLAVRHDDRARDRLTVQDYLHGDGARIAQAGPLEIPVGLGAWWSTAHLVVGSLGSPAATLAVSRMRPGLVSASSLFASPMATSPALKSIR